MHCLKYGLTVHNIQQFKLISIDGELVTIGSQALDAPGYDLLALMTGSEGMLGVIVEVKLTPKPERAQVILAAFDNVVTTKDRKFPRLRAVMDMTLPLQGGCKCALGPLEGVTLLPVLAKIEQLGIWSGGITLIVRYGRLLSYGCPVSIALLPRGLMRAMSAVGREPTFVDPPATQIRCKKTTTEPDRVFRIRGQTVPGKLPGHERPDKTSTIPP